MSSERTPINNPKCCSIQDKQSESSCKKDPLSKSTSDVAEVKQDPVCGMDVEQKSSTPTAEYKNQIFFFCCEGCKRKFLENPQLYISKKTKNQEAIEGAIYTCPMHPEIQQIGPGSCSICGMALEPLHATMEEDTTELDDMTRRFWFSLVLSLPLLALTMGDLAGWDAAALLGHQASAWLQALLATPVVL